MEKLISFFIGTLLLVLGLGLFTFGAENSMTRIGTSIGARMTASRSLPVICGISFLIGVIVTAAEPSPPEP